MSTAVFIKECDFMRIAKIKNSYLFKSNNPNGTHHYAVFYDRKNKRYNAVQLTHLYVKDKSRFQQVKRGNISIERFKEFDTPSGVKNSFYNKNSSGGNIDLRDKKNVFYLSKRNLDKKQSERIKNFAYKLEI